MGIKRRILSSGRKFITKHKIFYDKAMAEKEAAGDEAVWVDKVSISDTGNEKFAITTTIEGDWADNSDKLRYHLDGAGAVTLAAGVRAAAGVTKVVSAADGSTGVESTHGDHTLQIHVLRGGTAAIAKSGLTKKFTLKQSLVVLDPTHAHFARDDDGDNLKIKVEAVAATGQIPLENLDSWGIASHKYKVEVRLNTSAGDLVALDTGIAGLSQIDATTTYVVNAGSAAELSAVLNADVGEETTFFVKITPANAAASAYHEASAVSKTVTVAKQ